MPSEMNADKLADAIARVATRSASAAEREMVLDAASAHLVLLRAPKDEHGAGWDVCWHCRDCLIVEVPRCEKCPAPGDCDDEDCEADGCVEERNALTKARATGGDRG